MQVFIGFMLILIFAVLCFIYEEIRKWSEEK